MDPRQAILAHKKTPSPVAGGVGVGGARCERAPYLTNLPRPLSLVNMRCVLPFLSLLLMCSCVEPELDAQSEPPPLDELVEVCIETAECAVSMCTEEHEAYVDFLNMPRPEDGTEEYELWEAERAHVFAQRGACLDLCTMWSVETDCNVELDGVMCAEAWGRGEAWSDDGHSASCSSVLTQIYPYLES